MSGAVHVIGKMVDTVADAIKPGQPNSQVDLKTAALELVMPKLDADTIAKYVGKWSENLKEDLKAKEEQELLAKEEQQRRINQGLEKPKEEIILAERKEPKLKDQTYSVSEYMKLADALRQAGKEVSNDNLIDAKLAEEKLRLG